MSYVTHGKSGSKAYAVWNAIKQRCQRPASASYPRYGGRGIRICDRWESSFANFLADMGEPEQGMSLDRIDNDGDYEPSNCRWATVKQQASNRSTNHLIELRGRVVTISEAAREIGISHVSLIRRIRKGLPIDSPPRKWVPRQPAGRTSTGG